MKTMRAPFVLEAMLGLFLLLSMWCFSSVQAIPCDPACEYGICENSTGKCNCSTNWYGESCNVFVCDHNDGPCLSEGKCEKVGETDFICKCSKGYSGTLCQANNGIQPITLCPANEPALQCNKVLSEPTGICVIDPVTKKQSCLCSAGFNGTLCENEYNPCESRGCGIGTCINTEDGWFECECPEGYDKAKECDPFIDVCFDGYCVHGNCSLPVPHNGIDYICTCEPGYTGKNCSTPISFCADSPCANDATCSELSDFSGYTCTCPPYYEGDNCTIPYDPCECNTCANNGTCQSQYQTVSEGVYTYTTSCNCSQAFTGANCEVDVDECSTIDTPCQNEGTCVNTVGGYLCQCPPGTTGEFCEASVDECEENPCHNQGVCHNDANGFKCDCNSTEFTGPTCEIPLNQTCHYHQCHFGGVCEFNEHLMKPVCTCTPGSMGEFCSFVYHPCSMGSCDPEGTLECIGNSSSPIRCRCRDGYSGPTCSVNVHDTCQYNQCLNNGTCTDVNGTFLCSCLPGFSGRSCENVIITECQSGLQCASNTGECVRILEDEFCKCNEGWGGSDCSFNIDECASLPCQHGGTCIDLEGGYHCTCPSEYEGVNCQSLKQGCDPSPCKNGGSCTVQEDGLTACFCPDNYEGELCHKEVCPPKYNCTAVANDGKCDMECFNAACNFDGNDVCTTAGGVDPWAACPMCRDKYNNGYCDQECNNATCLYDGPDCKAQVKECPRNKVDECTALVGNGVCDSECNTYDCPIDAVDCGKQFFLQNYLVLVVRTLSSIPFDTSARDRLLLNLVNIINAQMELVSYERFPEDNIPDNFRGNGYDYWKLVLRVNIAFCESSCPTTMEQVLRLIEAAYSSGRNFDDVGLIEAISADAPEQGGDGGNNDIGTVVGAIIGVSVCVVLIAVVAFVLGKRVRNDGGMRESVKKLVRVRGTFRIPGGSTPEPSEANLMTRGQSCSSDRHSGSIDAFDDNSPSSMRRGNHPLPHFTWSQMEVPLKTVSTDGASSTSGSPKEGGATCVIGQRGKDERKWTYLHCEAARMSSDSRQLMSGSLRDVNAQGPAGLTPLMVAIMSEDKYHRTRGRPGGSIRSESSSGSEYSEYDPMIVSQSPKFGHMFSTIPHSKPFDSKIPTLIHAPQSNVNLINDQGETALHLAVKHNREEYIHYLTIAKADPNIQDKWGKTPIHVAIGAVNDRATQILIDCPNINLELKSHGGITPLMLAVKMGNNRVLQQLLAKNAEITATDAEGRTAVHWAAMINNVEALRMLIKQGPDNVKDAPNHKGETALFLACREGCLGSVRHLLDCYANATLVDSLERSPLLIAFEKQNFDVIEMLQQSNQGPLGGPSPPMYQIKPPHHVPTTAAPPMFGRTSRVKIEPPQVPPVIHSQAPPTSTTAQMRYPVQNTAPTQVEGMPRCSSIEAELADLVASTQYPDMLNYTSQMLFSSEPHSTPSETGHSPGNNNSVINPPPGAGGLSPGQSSTTDHTTFSPVGSDGVYTTTTANHTSPAAGLTPYSCANNPSVPASSAASLQPLTGSTPLQHLPTPYIEGGGSAHQTPSELQSSPMEPAVYTSTVPTSNNSPLMGQTVSPNPTPLTITPAATANGSSYLQTTMTTTGNTSPSSQYGFPSPPKEAGDYGAYGTPYNGENVNSVSSMTPSPEDGSSHHVDGSPSSQQYTTIHGQYSYSSDAYQISLQPCNTAAIRSSNFTGLSSFNPKESTV